MKGLFYVENNKVLEIMSEAMPARNEDGIDDICIVVKDTFDNSINVELVICVTEVYETYQKADDATIG